MVSLGYPRLWSQEADKTIQITKNPFVIGRGLDCDFVLPFTEISRHHCKIEKIGYSWFLQDNSTNGTFVNDQRIDRIFSKELNENDKVCLSQEDRFVYYFQLTEDSSTDDQLCQVVDSLLAQPNSSNRLRNANSAPPRVLSVIDLTDDNYINIPTTSSSNQSVIFVEEDKSLIQKPTEKDSVPSTSTSQSFGEKKVNEELVCSVCSEIFIKAITLNCGHTFCRFCIDTWRSKQSDCPICRTKIKSMNPSFVLDNIIEMEIGRSSKEVQDLRRDLVEQRKNAESLLTRDNIEFASLDDRSSIDYIQEPIDISIETETESSDTDNDLNWEELYNGDDWYQSRVNRPRDFGYGRCYACRRAGHWANNCPFR